MQKSNLEIPERFYFSPDIGIKDIPMLFTPLSLVIQDGPYCPLKCPHCYGKFGPHHVINNKKQVAPLELYQEVMNQLEDTTLEVLHITDGEPFHDIKRLERIISTIKNTIFTLNTSAYFASSQEIAEEYHLRLKEAGYSVKQRRLRNLHHQSQRNIMCVSLDEFHKVPLQYVKNFVNAFEKVFKKDIENEIYNPSKILPISIPLTFKSIKQFKKLNKEAQEIINNKTNDFVSIEFVNLENEGRGKQLFKQKIKTLKPNNLEESPNRGSNLYLKSNGYLYIANFFNCIADYRKIGNIFDRPLKTMMTELPRSKIYNLTGAFTVKEIYKILYDKNIKIKGRDTCDVCRTIFSNEKYLDTIFKELQKK